MNLLHSTLAFIALAAMPLTAGAQADADLTPEQLDSIESTFNLNEIVVTGTRTPKMLKDTPIQTRLISFDDIRSTDATDLQDLLQAELPGVEFSYAMNQQINMNLAGFGGQSVLVLVDGERLAGETMDNVDFSRLNMANVDRIEIVKGASSALYGSSAAGAVVNIITRRAEKPWQASLNARGGAHHEWRYGAKAGVAVGKVNNTFDVQHSRISTYHVCLNGGDECDFRSVPAMRVYNFKDRLTYTPLSNLVLTARAGYFFKERQYIPDAPDRYRDFTGGLRANWRLDSINTFELSYSYDQYDKSDYLRAQNRDVRDYRNVQNAVRGLYNHTFAGHNILTVGADFMRDYLDSYEFEHGAHEQTSIDAFGQFDWNINKTWEAIGALRYDYFSDSRESRVTAKLSGRYRWKALTLRAGYGGGFRAPTLKEKYMNFDMAGLFEIHGNADLKSESSHGMNASAEYTWLNYNFTLGGNYTWVSDKITTSGIVYGAEGPYLAYINVPHLRVAAVDAAINARWRGGFSARLAYAFTHESIAEGSMSQYCPARPHALNIRGAWLHQWHKNYQTELILSGRFLSAIDYTSMYMFEPFDVKYIHNPAYTLWKVQLNQVIARGATVTLAVDNILNYIPAVYSLNAPVTTGTTLMVGLQIDLDRF